MLKARFSELFENGCIQTGADTYNNGDEAIKKMGIMFQALWVGTDRNPCKECPVEKEKCLAYRRFNTEHQEKIRKQLAEAERRKNATKAPGTDSFPGLSVKQIAEKLNVSKSEVRRRKLAGTI